MRLILTPLVIAISACASDPVVTKQQSRDYSIASYLYSTEREFSESEASADAIGMAYAARSRFQMLLDLETVVPEGTIEAEYYRDGRRRLIEVSIQDMVARARELAKNDPDVLAEIERLFPGNRLTLSEPPARFGRIFGDRRAVKITIGIEIDATLEPAVPDRLRVPVDSRSGTTIYIQPVASHPEELIADLSMFARLHPSPPGVDEYCANRSSHGRLTCFVAPGEYAEIEIVLTNHGDGLVPVVIFVSGNAQSVTDALEQKDSLNQIGDMTTSR